MKTSAIERRAVNVTYSRTWRRSVRSPPTPAGGNAVRNAFALFAVLLVLGTAIMFSFCLSPPPPHGVAGEPFDGYAFATTVDAGDSRRAPIAAGVLLRQSRTLNGYDHWKILKITRP